MMLAGLFIATRDLKRLLMDTEQWLYFLALTVIKMFSAGDAKDLFLSWGKLHKMAVHIHHRRHRLALPKKPQLSKFSPLRRVTVTRNGLRCFLAPVNRLPACEGVRWVWYRILFNPETMVWPLGRSIPHAAHPSRGAIEWMGYGGLFPGEGEEEPAGERGAWEGVNRGEGWQISPRPLGWRQQWPRLPRLPTYDAQF